MKTHTLPEHNHTHLHAPILTALALAAFGCEPTTSQYVAPQPASTQPVQTSCIPSSPIPSATPSPTPSASPTVCTGPFCGGGVLGEVTFLSPEIISPRATMAACPTNPPAVLSFDGSISDFGPESIGSYNNRSLTVINFGQTTATSIDASTLQGTFTFTGGIFPGTGGTCGAELAPSATCTIVVDFYPQAVQGYTTILALGYFDGQNQQVLTQNLSGIGVAYPTLSFQSPTLPFGNVLLGTESTQTVTVQYAGTYPATGISVEALSNGFGFLGGSYPGTGGTCGVQIGAKCTLVLTATPSAAIQSSVTLNLNYDNGAFAASASLGLSQTGVATPTPAALQISPAITDPAGNFGNQTVGTQQSVFFTVTNSGTLPATGVSGHAFTTTAFSFTGGSYPGTGGSCSNQIAGSCLIAMIFAPGTQGVISDSIGLSYSNGVSLNTQNLSYAIRGTGVVAANLVWSTATSGYDLGTQSIGATVSKSFTLTNTSLTLAANGLQFTGMSNGFSVASTTCASSVGPNASCAVTVAFTPAQVGSFDTQISALYSNGFTAAVASQEFVAEGTDAALLVFQPAAINFGSVVVGSSESITLTVKYYGTQPASQINWNAMNGPSYYYNGGTCSTVISEDCTVAIQFLPQMTGTVSTPILLLYYDGYQSQSATLGAQANGITPAHLSFSSGNAYNFGAISTNNPVTTQITVSNTGQASATSSAFSALSAPFSMIQNGCGTSIPGNSSCTLTVGFDPTAVAAYNSSLQISYLNGLMETSASTSLQGTGSADPTLGVGGGSGGGTTGGGGTGSGGGTGGSASTTLNYNFGNVFVGSNASNSFTISYTGVNPASIVSVNGLAGPNFVYDSGSTFPGSGSCGANSIVSTCTFGIMFQPSQSGALTATFSLVYNDGVAQHTLQINLSGTGIQPAVLSGSPANNVFPSTPLNYTRAQSFTVTNSSTSQSTAVLKSLSSIPSPFTYAGGTCFGTSGSSPISLSPNASCSVILAFDPQAANSFNQAVSLTYFNGTQNQVLSLNASGSGTSAALLVLEQGTSFNFGSVIEGGTGTEQISVQYYGASTAAIQSIQVSAPFTATTGTCGASVAQACAIDVTFSPTVSGTTSDVLTVTYGNGAGQTQTATVTLSGKGITPALVTTAASLTFNPILINQTESQTLQLKNSGNTSASQIQFSGLSAPFTVATNGCSGSVATSCQVGVSFLPTQNGSFSQTLNISYYDGQATQNISVPITGMAVISPSLTSTPQGSTGFQTIALGSQTSLTYLIANSGSDVANGLTLQNPSANVGFSVTQSTCAGSLALGQNCSVTVLFNPSAPGPSSDQFSFSYTGSAGGSFTLPQNLTAQATVPVQLATKGNHTCVINVSGQVECWGEADYGQCGPVQKQVIPLGAGHYATAIATGYFHSCAILENGMLKCWGRNDSGQLGLGDSNNRGLSANDLGDNLPAVNLGTGRTAAAISLGYSHTCALLDNASVKCWGGNLQGELGQGDTVMRGTLPTDMGDNLAPISLGTGLTAVSLSSNVGQNCVILSNQTVKCWGDNFYGELGLGDAVNRGDKAGEMGDELPAVALQTGSTPAQIDTGGGFTCVNSTQGQVSCWGFNYHGTLGTCWALNSAGQVGSCFNPAYTNWVQGYGMSAGEMGDALPTVDLGLAETGIPVQSITSGTSFSCATYTSGAGGLKCFGDNSQGQLGLGSLTNQGDEPGEMGASLPSVSLGTAVGIRNVVAGSYHTCAVFQDNSVRCWGDNAEGQLGMSLSNLTWGGAANQMGSELPTVNF